MHKIQWKKLFQAVDDKHAESDKIIPLDLGPPINLFNHDRFWVADVNFRLKKSSVFCIGRIDGVESINAVSPYKFIVCIGELFDENQIKLKIEQEICGNITLSSDNQIIPIEFLSKVEEVRKDNEKWLVYMLPNEKIIVELGDNIDYDFYEKAANLCGALYISDKLM